MKQLRTLEVLTTKYFVVLVLLIIAITIVSFYIFLARQITDVETLATFVDAVFKTVAILVGALWALNRYFISRVDIPQLRVETDVSLIPTSEFKGNETEYGLLVYRLDITNTGNTLIAPYHQYLIVHALSPSSEGVKYEQLYRWPDEGVHPGGPIEPKSWAAINDEVSVLSTVRAVHMYLELQLEGSNTWTWHKTFNISNVKASSSA